MPVPGVTKEYRRSILAALHASALKVAFFTKAANLDKSVITAYSASGEVSGPGYVAGGFALTTTLVDSTDPPYLDFADLTIANLSISNWDTMLVYNTTDANRAIAVIQLAERTLVNKSIIIQWPAADVSSAIVRVLG